MKNKLNKAKKKVHTTPNEPEIDQIYFETLKRKKIQQFWSRIPQKYNKQQGYEVRGQQLTKLTFLPLSTKRQKWNKTRKDTTMLQLGREKKVYENPEVKSRLEPWLQFNDDVITPFLI